MIFDNYFFRIAIKETFFFLPQQAKSESNTPLGLRNLAGKRARIDMTEQEIKK